MMCGVQWTNEEGVELFGPFTAQQMQAWSEAGYFGEGVFCRKIGQVLCCACMHGWMRV